MTPTEVSQMLLPWAPAAVVTIVLGIFSIRVANGQKLVAEQQKEIARQAKDIAHAKLKLDLFDRRMKVFQSAWGLLSFGLQMSSTDEYHAELRAKRFELQNQLPEALFLFGSETYDYLSEVIHQMSLQEMRWQRARSNSFVMPPELIEEDLQHGIWVGKEAGIGLRDRFAPFLDFGRWQ